jgi:DNA-binding PadR family transcriptional regulator
VNISSIIFFIPDTGTIRNSELLSKVEKVDDKVADQLNVPKSKDSIYISIVRLERQGLIESGYEVIKFQSKGKKTKAKREKIIQLTDEGRELVRQMRSIVFAGNIEDKITQLTDEVTDVIKKVFEAYSKRIFK